MLKKIRKYIELSFEIDKTYMTKMSTQETFTIKELSYNKDGKVIACRGIYTNSPHLGICPIDISRLIADKEFAGNEDVCSKCGEPL